MSKRTLKDWFYFERVSHRAIDNIMQTPKKEVHFFFFSVCCIVFNCYWQLIIFDKKQKSCVKRIHLVTDYGLYDRKAFYTVKKIVFLFIFYEWWRIYQFLRLYLLSIQILTLIKKGPIVKFFRTLFLTFRSRHWEIFCKNSVLKVLDNFFVKVLEKLLYIWSSFLIQSYRLLIFNIIRK